MRKSSVRQFAEAYYDVATGASAQERVAIAKEFLKLLARQRLLRKMPRIFAELDRITAERGGPEVVSIRSAVHMDEKADAQLTENLEKSLGRKVKLNNVHDAKLLAGAKIQVGDTLIDNSLASRLASLKAHLLESS